MSKIWKYLNVANHQEISDEIYQYIVDHTDRLLDHHYFVDHSIPHMLRYCPLLTNFLNSRYLMPTRLASIVCSNDAMIPMHRDSDGEHPYVRILWPIKNCQGSKNKFWKAPDGVGKLTSDTNGTLYTEFPKNQEYKLIDEFELSSPLVFDTSCIHSVEPNVDLPGSRISFTIGFDQDLPISKTIRAWVDFELPKAPKG